MRPLPHAKKLPDSLFWWEGPDGSRLLAYRLPFSYNDEGPVEGRLHKIISELHEPTQVLMAFYGVGDQGGGPLCRDPGFHGLSFLLGQAKGRGAFHIQGGLAHHPSHVWVFF